MKTVFVLGAGASKPYGFPLGPELKDAVQSKAFSGILLSNLGYTPFTPELITKLRAQLRHGIKTTMDDFLDFRKEFRHIGGCLIAESILAHESQDNILGSKNWYYSFLWKLREKIIRNQSISDISIVTLNYDRSLEYFLSERPDFIFEQTEIDKIKKEIAHIKIIHAHGSLGSLEELPYGENIQHPVQSVAAPKLMEIGARLKIVSDKLEDSLAFQEAKREISQAERLVMIGLGYHDSIMRNLFSNINPLLDQVYGTAVKIDSVRLKAIREYFGQYAKLNNEINDHNADNIMNSFEL